jgi:hypothetical protein
MFAFFPSTAAVPARTAPMHRGKLVLTALLAFGCSKGGGNGAKQPDGSYVFRCKGPLTDCLKQAERACGDDGYVVASARDVRELVGHESGQSQVAIQKSDATVFCGQQGAPARAFVELKREQPLTSDAPAPVPAPSPVPAPVKPVCTPGATQACVGPAGCSGGQVCSADGARFEACDCGKPEAPSPPGAASHD